jgi:hypothetical protein
MQAPMAAADMAACVSSRSHLVPEGTAAAMARGVNGAVAATGGAEGATSAARGDVDAANGNSLVQV